MELYILRHAEAVERDQSALPDEWRWLTAKGNKCAAKIGKALEKQRQSSLLILSSPLVRAVQTAQIVSGRIGGKCRIEVNSLLLPGTAVEDVIAFLHQLEEDNLMLVGHEPQLGGLVGALLQSGEPFHLKKCGCVRLKLDRGDRVKPAAFISYMVAGEKKVTSLKKAFRDYK